MSVENQPFSTEAQIELAYTVEKELSFFAIRLFSVENVLNVFLASFSLKIV